MFVRALCINVDIRIFEWIQLTRHVYTRHINGEEY